MKNQKGFTLVELLAVIVILAVVILIAVTAVIPRMNSARKNAFADEAMAYIKAAKEANVEDQMDGSAGGTCYTIGYLNENYIDKKSDSYEGFVEYDPSEDVWYAYIKNDKYMINGGSGKLSKIDVEDAGELTSTPSECTAGSEDEVAIYMFNSDPVSDYRVLDKEVFRTIKGEKKGICAIIHGELACFYNDDIDREIDHLHSVYYDGDCNSLNNTLGEGITEYYCWNNSDSSRPLCKIYTNGTITCQGSDMLTCHLTSDSFFCDSVGK